MPVMAVGGEKSFGPLQAVIMRHLATNVQEEVVAGSGHWLMEERPEYTVALIRKFIDGPPVAHQWQAVLAVTREKSDLRPPNLSSRSEAIRALGAPVLAV